MNDTRELAATRTTRIGQILSDRRTVRVRDLCADLGVSPATVRRDLLDMERLGRLTRVHGGAVSAEPRFDEPLFEDKEAMATAEKQAIARTALAFVKPAEAVFLDGGSTVLALARLLQADAGLTVVTNSLRVASTFAGHGPRTIVVGGELRRRSQTFVGPLTEPMISRLHVETAFVGTIGLALDGTLSTTDPREAQTKALVMDRARTVVLLADSAKIGRSSFVRFGRLQDVDVLITDSGVGAREMRALRRTGVRVLRAEDSGNHRKGRRDAQLPQR